MELHSASGFSGGEVHMEFAVKMNEEISAGFAFVSENSGRANAVAFDSAELRTGPFHGQGIFLIVSGPAPKNGANVRLLPALGDRAPEYRRIEIVSESLAADNDRDFAEQSKRYEKSIPLSGLMGSKGVELIGANGSKKFGVIGQ